MENNCNPIPPLFTIDDYNALRRAIMTGAKKIKFGEEETEFRSIGEMRSLLQMMEIELGIGCGRVRRTQAVTSKGL